MTPYLVQEIKNGNRTVERFNPQVRVRNMASAGTIQDCQTLLAGVVENGTAKNLRSQNFAIAGKTGTNLLTQYIGTDKKKYQASFVGYFPADQPKYSCIVVVNDPKGEKYSGGKVAGVAFKEIADKIFAKHPEWHADLLALESESSESSLPNFEIGATKDIDLVLSALEVPHGEATDAEWTCAKVEDGQLAMLYRSVPENLVPNVEGMGLRDAIYLLESKGLRVSFTGMGKVRSQSVQPGIRINGQTVYLQLG